MNNKQLRTQSDNELRKMLGDLKSELFNLRFSNATGQLANPMALDTCKKNIARVNTILRERELGISESVKPQEEEKKATKKSTAKKVETKKD